MTTTIRPNARGISAYRLGYKAHGAGKSLISNPGVYMPSGSGFSAWWETGWLDSYAGKPDRFADA